MNIGYIPNMDAEKGLPIGSKKESSDNSMEKPHNHNSNKSWKIAITLTVLLAILACALSVCTLAFQLWGHHCLLKKDFSGEYDFYNSTKEQQVLDKVAHILYDSEYNETAQQGQRVSRMADWTSEFYPSLMVKPSAHITGKMQGDTLVHILETASTKVQILSAGWTCDSIYKGHILGGMQYNSVNGFLKVPVKGIYFVYSQVLLNISSPNTVPNTNGAVYEPVKLGHSTVSCQCNNEKKIIFPCFCAKLQGGITYNNFKAKSMMESYSWYHGLGGTSYQGALFELDANSYIAVVPKVPDIGSPKFNIQATNINSFFGAFFVTGLTPPPSPSPPPPPSPSPSLSPSPSPSPSAYSSPSPSPSVI